MQQTLRRFPHAAIVLELHLQSDPPQTVGFLHYLQLAGCVLRSIGYKCGLPITDPDAILARLHETCTLWLQR